MTFKVCLDCRLTIASPVYGRQISPRIGLVSSHVTRSEFLDPNANHISGTANAKSRQMLFTGTLRQVLALG